MNNIQIFQGQVHSAYKEADLNRIDKQISKSIETIKAWEFIRGSTRKKSTRVYLKRAVNEEKVVLGKLLEQKRTILDGLRVQKDQVSALSCQDRIVISQQVSETDDKPSSDVIAKKSWMRRKLLILGVIVAASSILGLGVCSWRKEGIPNIYSIVKSAFDSIFRFFGRFGSYVTNAPASITNASASANIPFSITSIPSSITWTPSSIRRTPAESVVYIEKIAENYKALASMSKFLCSKLDKYIDELVHDILKYGYSVLSFTITSYMNPKEGYRTNIQYI